MRDDLGCDESTGLVCCDSRHLQRQKALKEEILGLLDTGGIASLKDIPRRLFGLGLFEALLDKAWALRRENPGQMIQLSLLAVQLAPKLNARRYGAQKLIDLQCRAWTELGNAYRVADQLGSAYEAFCRANALYEQGTQDKSTLIRLLDFQASLAADQRHFGLACTVLAMLQKHHLTAGNDHQAGRSLVSRALYTGYSGKPEEAVELLREALSLVDETKDPDLAFTAAHNQVTFSVDCGSFDEAKKFLFLNRRRLAVVGGASKPH